MKQEKSKLNQKITKEGSKIIYYNFITRTFFENEVLNDFIQNINKEKYNYYRIFNHLK
jgi:hypothetical protein